MTRLEYLALYAVMLVVGIVLQFARDGSISARDAAEAAATAAIVTVLIALLICYLDRRRRK